MKAFDFTVTLLLFLAWTRKCCSITVLTTERSTETQWTCFDTDSAEACCQGILQQASQQQQQQPDILQESKAPPELDVCVSQISAVPTIESLQRLAKFSLIQYHGPHQQDTTGNARRPQQSIWTDEKSVEVDSSSNHTSTTATGLYKEEEEEQQQQDSLYFPFLLEPVVPSPSVEIHSELSLEGGMHRLLHSRISSSDPHLDDATTTSTYLFLTLSNSMFMDLDDALLPQDNSLAASVTVRVHSAGVCDIEQPAFASGQHVVVLESKSSSKNSHPANANANANANATTTFLELTSKVHFRYPVPSPDRHQWSILFLPQVLVVTEPLDQGKRMYSTTAAAAVPQETQRVWVAAGSDADYVWVMGTTLAMALLGTISMLQSFSLVSQWDA